jgi:type I restriction enzyme, S subunit
MGKASSIDRVADSWTASALGGFGTIVGGGTPSRSQESYWKGAIPWASVKDFRDDSVFLDDTVEHITEAAILNSAATLVPANTPVVCTRMAVGRCALTSRPTAINQDLKAFLLARDVDVHFFIRMLRFYGPVLDRISVGSTVRGINLKDLLSLEVYHPTAIDTQARIAHVLDTIDEAIQKTEAVIAKLKQIRAGMLHDLLTYGLDKDGKLRDPIAHPEQFKDSELGRIPKEWEVAEIAQLFDLGRGRVISQHDLRACPGDNPVYSSQSANDGIFGYLGTFDFEGDYITWTTDGANAGTVFFRSGRFNCTNVCGTLKSKGRLTEAFGALALGTVAKKHVSYVGNPKLMNNIVARIKIKYPKSIDEQQDAVNALAELNQKVDTENRELQKLHSLKAGLMDDLLSGNVAVPADLLPEEVPA